MTISITTTVALSIHCDANLSTLTDEELQKLLSSLDEAAQAIRGEKARRWVAAGKPVSPMKRLIDEAFVGLGSNK